LYLEATRRCNLRCPYCSSGSNKPGLKDSMSFKDIKERILFPAKEIGTKFLDLSGGEFLIRNDSFEILRLANDLGFRIGIASNGLLLTENKLDKLQDLLGNNLLISLGINSFDEENEFTRQVPINYTLELIERLKKRGIATNVAITMGNFNADSFAETVEKIKNLGLAFNRIPYTPRNTKSRVQMFDKITLKEKLHPVLNSTHLGYVSFVPFFLNPNDYFNKSSQKECDKNVPLNPSVGCWVGSFYGINPEGEVSPCPLLGDHVSGGNILETPLKDILFKSELFTKITARNNLKGKCGKCKYRFTCGGCRVMAYYLTGDVFAEDPTCFIEELSAEELEKLEKQTKSNFKKYYILAKMGGSF
ncbi:MAG TPA: radical SAM protein, partial [Bacteroidales bacterium]|nr:radical SAM protein [Bacteroidales bacterium]